MGNMLGRNIKKGSFIPLNWILVYLLTQYKICPALSGNFACTSKVLSPAGSTLMHSCLPLLMHIFQSYLLHSPQDKLLHPWAPHQIFLANFLRYYSKSTKTSPVFTDCPLDTLISFILLLTRDLI